MMNKTTKARKYGKININNGLRLITVPMKSNQTVTVLVLVEAGSKYEPESINGVSHFLEHMCFKGTTLRPTVADISYDLDSIGSQSNAFTGQEYTGYYAKSHYKKLPQIIDIISDIYLNSTFPEKEIEKEKGVVIEEINMYEDLPQAKVWDVFTSLLYGDQPVGRTVLGTKETIKSLSRKDVINYRRKHYVSSKTTVVVAGKINEEEVKQSIKKAFNGISDSKPTGKKKVKETQTSPQVRVYNKKTDQTHLVLGFRSENLYSKNDLKISLLATILGSGMSSRLFQKLREELGMCYYVRASHSPFTDHGYFTVSAGVGNERAGEAVSAILGEIRKIKEERVTEKELQKAKDFKVGNFSLSLESSDSLAEYYGFQELFKQKVMTPDDVVKKIQSVTADDISEMAKKIFTEEGLNLALVGPYKNDAQFLPLLKL
jgi:predicted Zn-dependent peptidase